MKHLHAYLLSFLAVFFLSQEIQSQNMVLRLKGTGDQTVALKNLQKITFSNNNLVLNYTTGDAQSYSFSNLEKLYFSPLTSVKDLTAPSTDVLFNSSDNQLHFRNLSDGTHQITVYRIDGKTVINKTISNNESIDMTPYPASIYLVRINNQVLKFKK